MSVEGKGEMHFDAYPRLVEISSSRHVHNTLGLKPPNLNGIPYQLYPKVARMRTVALQLPRVTTNQL